MHKLKAAKICVAICSCLKIPFKINITRIKVIHLNPALYSIKGAVCRNNIMAPVGHFIQHNHKATLRAFNIIISKLFAVIIVHNSIRHLWPTVNKVPPDYTAVASHFSAHMLNKELLSLCLRNLRSQNIIIHIGWHFAKKLCYLTVHKHCSAIPYTLMPLVGGVQIPLPVILIRPHKIFINKFFNRLPVGATVVARFTYEICLCIKVKIAFEIISGSPKMVFGIVLTALCVIAHIKCFCRDIGGGCNIGSIGVKPLYHSGQNLTGEAVYGGVNPARHSQHRVNFIIARPYSQ